MSLAQKIVQIRKMKGLSQEELSDKAGISLRTLQRIEKEETEPRGHTLRAITEVLEVPIEELMDFTKREDKGFLKLMSLSALAYWFMPLLNIIVPLVLWLFKRENIKDVDKVGRQIISFQILWSIFAYGVPLLFIIILPFLKGAPGDLLMGYTYIVYGVPIFFYLLNTILIIVTFYRIKRHKNWVYIFPLKFI